MTTRSARSLTLLATGMLAASLAAGCARLSVKSEPAGARVMWSPDGQEDWRPWPPRTWGKQPAPGEEKVTPYATVGGYFDTVWVTVEKDGYFRPLPQSAELYTFRNETLRFNLVETPQSFEARQRAAGLVPYRGQWVDPTAEGLAEFDGTWLPKDEAFRLEQRAKGLVEYQGAWMTPADYLVKFAEDQRAKGLVEFKNRWMTPAARDAEQALDAEAAAIGERRDVQALEAPRVIGRTDLPTAQVQLLNATGNAVRFILSGPTTREVVVAGYGSYGLSGTDRLLLDGGRYKVAVVPGTGSGVAAPADPNTTAAEPIVEASTETTIADAVAFLEAPLSAGFQYLYTYNGGNELDLRPDEDYQLGEPTLPDNLPTIVVPEIVVPTPVPTPVAPEGAEGRRGGPGGRPGGGPGGGQRPGGGGQRPGGGGAPR